VTEGTGQAAEKVPNPPAPADWTNTGSILTGGIIQLDDRRAADDGGSELSAHQNRWLSSSWAKAGLFFAAYLLAAELGNAVSAQHVYPTFWPPAGLVLAVLLLSDFRDWPLLIGVSILANVSSDVFHQRLLVVSLAFALANATEALVGASLVRRFVGGKPDLQTVRQVLVFAAFGAVLAPALGALLGAGTAMLAGDPAPLWSLWGMWWTGHAAGVVIVASPVLTGPPWWREYRSMDTIARSRQTLPLASATAVTVFFTLVAWVVFTASSGATGYKFLSFTGILIAGAIGGPFAGAISLFCIATTGIAGMASVLPLAEVLTATEAAKVFQAEGFFIVTGITSLSLTVALAENRRLATAATKDSARLLEGTRQLERLVEEVVETMGKVVEARDPYTQGHETGVAKLSNQIAREMGLPGDLARAIEMAALVHDIGKLSVPSEILTKPGKLTVAEFSLIKQHPQAGFDILKDIEFGWPIADVALHHHERLDGSGYPQGLRGEEISVAARVVAVADVVDAMASHRPYRPALGLDTAVAEIRDHPEKYDSEASAACLRLYETGLIEL
jgi:integral membrane sensor domain MASE1